MPFIHRKTLRALCSLFAIGQLSFACADDAAKPDDTANTTAKPKTVKVETTRLTTSVTTKGTFEAEDRSEVKLRLKAWTNPLFVETAVAHGALVKKGDPLITFETEKLEQQIRELHEAHESSKLALHLAELEFPQMKAQLPLDLLAAERAHTQNREDLDAFLKVEKAQEIDMLEFGEKSTEFNIETAKAELQQLEKMYLDKDLTEETEQMILKRYRFNLEQAEKYGEQSRYSRKKSIEVSLPRKEESLKLEQARAEIAWERARTELPLRTRQKELALETLKAENRRATERLADLEHDLAQLKQVATAAGVVYHGRYSRGQWTSQPATSYVKGGIIQPGEVVMTVISPGKLFLFTEVEEKDVGSLSLGQTVRLSPTVAPLKKFAGKVHRIVPFPLGGKHEVIIAAIENAPEGVYPGMTASAKIMTAVKEKALALPSSAVFEDADEEQHYVYRPGEKPTKQVVSIGLVTADKTEITAGLKEGDEVLAEKP